MKKIASVTTVLTILLCLAVPVRANATDTIENIKSGETVYSSPIQNSPEEYTITASADGAMTISITSDSSVVVAVLDSSGKEVAPTEYFVTAGDSSDLFTNVGHDAYGYYLSHVVRTSDKGSKTGSADFIYNVKKGEYTIKLSTYHNTIAAITMVVTAPTAITATPTASTVQVNGKTESFDAYNIGGNNYFKLRDLAYALNNSEKHFEVTWDGVNNAILITSGAVYTSVGGEMESGAAGNQTATPTTSKVMLDGHEVALTAYNIRGNNYFKLRDIGEALDFGVDWDGTNNRIIIDTAKGYTADAENQPSGSIAPNVPNTIEMLNPDSPYGPVDPDNPANTGGQQGSGITYEEALNDKKIGY